jgi:outer membrane lipoprotein
MPLRTRPKNPFTLLWGAVLFLSACASTIPPEVLTDVDQTVSFERLKKNPDAFTGNTVVLGGEIIQAENHPQNTRLVVLQKRLDGDLKPLDNDQSEGRFMVMVPEFLDPAIYTKGRQITAVGTVTGKEIRPLSGIPYVYPVMERRYLHLWPVERSSESEPRVQFGIGIGIGIGNYGY